ncbi:MAG: protein phosphatase CheZ [Burkholderiaceae bacterium]|nr:protein phosphatase CheZ [Burkholderiaceae bacterium]
MTDAVDDDNLQALFDEVSSQTKAPVETAAPAAVAAEATAGEEGADQGDKPMFERLGGIVRLLHDSLRELGYDRSLSTVATQITDAQGRLEYVASLTEQAANKTLNAVDVGMPEQDLLQKKAQDMASRWDQLFEGKLSVSQFKELASDSRQFASAVSDSTEAEKARLLEIMMAQDFQDITGQLIKKIVVITTTAEKELAQVLRDNAPPETKAAMAAAAEEASKAELMSGPSMPSAALVQDDVDSLLADLGF